MPHAIAGNRPEKWDAEFAQLLLAAQDYREFLKPFFRGVREDGGRIRHPKALTYAEFSRRAGFASRAFIRDVLKGHKSLSRESAERASTALRLQGAWKEYLALLLQASLRGPDVDPVPRLARVRAQLAKPRAARIDARKRKEAKTYLDENLSTVFAACGSQERGATEAEIASRTRLPPQKVGKALLRLASLGVVRLVQGRYYPADLHLALENLGSDACFKNDYRAALTRASERFDALAASGRALFFVSTLAVRAERMPELRERLRELLLEFVTQSEEVDGDAVSELVLGFTLPP